MHPAIIIGIVRSLIVDVAMGQIPRSTERISSCPWHYGSIFNYFADAARDLGFIFYEHFSFSDQISALSKLCYSQIRQLRYIWPVPLPPPSCTPNLTTATHFTSLSRVMQNVFRYPEPFRLGVSWVWQTEVRTDRQTEPPLPIALSNDKR